LFLFRLSRAVRRKLRTMFKIVSNPIDPAAWQQTLTNVEAGACVTFAGWVRQHNQGLVVLSLEYEAYAVLAVAEGKKILAEAYERFAVVGIAAVHRTGHLQLGELAVWVGVTANHRDAAFGASRYVIDEMKARLPIWKKEYYTGGATAWINCATRGEHGGLGALPSS
jgi:molybdopterin synthase catalytic subunit